MLSSLLGRKLPCQLYGVSTAPLSKMNTVFSAIGYWQGIKTKAKTVSAVKKRFRLTNSGNIKRGQTGMRHNTGPKAPNRKQSLRQTRLVHGQQRKKLLEMLGGA